MIDKWKKAVDSHKFFGGVLTDLSKAFGCICHDLLIAELKANGLSLPALKLIKDYVQNRKKGTRIGVTLQWLGRYYFRSSTRINTRTSSVQNLFMWPISWRWRQLLCKLCWWYHPILFWQRNSRHFRKSILSYQKIVSLVCKQSNDSKRW